MKPACIRGPAPPSRSSTRPRTRISRSPPSTFPTRRTARPSSPRSIASSSCPSTSATTGTRSPTCSRTATGSARRAASIVFAGSGGYRKQHPTDWATLEDILVRGERILEGAPRRLLDLHRLSLRRSPRARHGNTRLRFRVRRTDPSAHCLALQDSDLGARARIHARPARAAHRARRLSRSLAVGDRQPGGRRDARGHRDARAARGDGHRGRSATAA